MAAWYDAYITTKPGVQGGAPIIRNTRTPVRSVVLYLRVYDNDVSEVRRALSHLSHQEIDAALAYYRDNSDIVDADIQQHEQARDQFLAKA